ncbi:hypothetical protein FOCC_FOCC016004 [Frankliniella occidentalis]|nr:hypothetical protein FOCC_FOCC016004 [Frankliniella occidentalis]
MYNANESLWKGQKKNTQARVKRLMGLSVDEVKQGAGNTNSGNTYRRFFANPSLAAEATGVDEGLIERYANILAAISCTESPDLLKCKVYCEEPHKYYDSKYPWYPMPPSIHMILVHGVDIMKSIDLPMGAYTEEALKALNKYDRLYRRHQTRITSRLSG